MDHGTIRGPNHEGPLHRYLNALSVVGVQNRAARPCHTSRGSGPSASAALAPFGLAAADDGGEGGGGWSSNGGCSGSGRGGDGSCGGSRGGSNRCWGRDPGDGSATRGSGDGYALGYAACGAGDQGRTRDRVDDGRLVNVKEDARVGSLVQGGARDTGGEVRSGTGDGEVEALRVGLGAVGVS